MDEWTRDGSKKMWINGWLDGRQDRMNGWLDEFLTGRDDSLCKWDELY